MIDATTLQIMSFVEFVRLVLTFPLIVPIISIASIWTPNIYFKEIDIGILHSLETPNLKINCVFFIFSNNSTIKRL